MEKLLHERLREYDYGDFSFELQGGNEIRCLYPSEAEALADEIERYYIPRPRFEDGEPVQFGSTAKTRTKGEVAPVSRICFTPSGFYFNSSEGNVKRYEYGEPVKRPTPKVLDADGVEIKVGKPIFTAKGEEKIVEGFEGDEDEWLVWCGEYESNTGIKVCYIASECTIERPVFDADGVRCFDGETVYLLDKVRGIVERPSIIDHVTPDGTLWWKGGGCAPAYMFTHREPDSLEKLRDDMAMTHDAAEEPNSTTEEWINRITALIERGA